MNYKIIHISPVSVTIELENDCAYYANEEYDIYINDKFIRKEKRNVASIFDLLPNQEYLISIGDVVKQFKTLNVEKIININEFEDFDIKSRTKAIQEVLDNSENSLVVFEEGKYLCGPLAFHSNSFIYFKKGAELIGSTDRNDYPIVKAIGLKDGKKVVNATWEGEAQDAYMSLISVVDSKNIMFIGEGIINGNADKADWWVDHRTKRGAWRPNNVFTNRADNIDFVGLSFINSPSWNLHPFYSENIRFIDLFINSVFDSPNTDGCDPESCRNVMFLGNKISVGDDCVAIKSGKYSMAKDFYKPCENITIRNCYMGDGHGGVVFGSESSCGIKHVSVSQCIFENTERGLRIKTKRGRGNKAIIEDVVFNNIKMNNVESALVINMGYYLSFEKFDPLIDGKDYVPINDLTPYIGSLTFKNMTIENAKVCAGYFYGLKEAPIKEIILENIKVSYNQQFKEYKEPAAMYQCDKLCNAGFYFYNVESYQTNNVEIIGQKGLKFVQE